MNCSNRVDSVNNSKNQDLLILVVVLTCWLLLTFTTQASGSAPKKKPVPPRQPPVPARKNALPYEPDEIPTILEKARAKAAEQTRMAREGADAAAPENNRIARESEAFNASLKLPKKQPSRPELKRLDVSDKAACRNELAELSSLRFKVTRGKETVFEVKRISDNPNPSPLQAIDCRVRLDRLINCQDEQLKSAAKEVRELHAELWQLSRVNHDFGATRRHRDAATQGLLTAGVSRAMSGVFIEASRPKQDLVYAGRDVNGNPRYEYGPEKPPDAELVAAVNAKYDKAIQQVQEWLKNMHDTSHRLSRVEVYRQDRLAKIWQTVLIPAFRATAAPSKAPLMQAQMLPNGDAGDFATITNVSKKTLHNVAVEFQANDGKGATIFWYGYVPTLKSDETIHLSGKPSSGLESLFLH